MNVTNSASEKVVRRLTKQQGYTWEVESDAVAWETANDGMRSFSDEPGNPWLETAGLFADDDTLELMLQEIYAERAAERLVA